MKAGHKPKYHHGDLKKKLLDVSLKLIEAEGFQTISMRRIAKYAGVSHAAPYHHFADKRQLLSEVAQRGFGMLANAILTAIEGEPRNALQIRKMAIAYIAFAHAHPQLYRLMFSTGVEYTLRTSALSESASAAFGLLKNSLGYSGSHAHFDNVAIACWSLSHGLAMLLIDGRIVLDPSEDLHSKMGQILDVMWHGLSKDLD